MSCNRIWPITSRIVYEIIILYEVGMASLHTFQPSIILNATAGTHPLITLIIDIAIRSHRVVNTLGVFQENTTLYVNGLSPCSNTTMTSFIGSNSNPFHNIILHKGHDMLR